MLGALLLGCIVTACASLMGVEEATLRDPETSADGGPSGDDGSTQVDGSLADGCVGAGCPCSGDADCKDPKYGKCVGGVCQACTTSPDSCPLGRFCLAGSHDAGPGANEVNECAPGCSSDEACIAVGPSAPYCDLARHQCVACRSDDDCGEEQRCSPSGKCADKCTSDGGSCSKPGEVCCSGICIDPDTEIGHCGTCNNACASGEQCCGGACTNRLTDVDNCGECGVACSRTNGTPLCIAGACNWRCDPGYHHCLDGQNTGCETATSSNVAQCGGCTNDCNKTVANAGPVACVESKCTYVQCKAGFADCDGNRANGCECKCGREGEACCEGRKCDRDLTCDPSNRCIRCGRMNEPCCDGSRCAGANARCVNGVCTECIANGKRCDAPGPPGASTECCSGYCKEGPGASGNHKCEPR